MARITLSSWIGLCVSGTASFRGKLTPLSAAEPLGFRMYFEKFSKGPAQGDRTAILAEQLYLKKIGD
jgi:hypothetical protein